MVFLNRDQNIEEPASRLAQFFALLWTKINKLIELFKILYGSNSFYDNPTKNNGVKGISHALLQTRVTNLTLGFLLNQKR